MPTIIIKRVAAMAVAEKQTEEIIFDNTFGLTVNDILTYGDANEAFRKIDINVVGVEWEAKPLETELQEAAVNVPHIHNN